MAQYCVNQRLSLCFRRARPRNLDQCSIAFAALKVSLCRSLPSIWIAPGGTLITLSDAMVENQKFPLPPEIDEILDRLPPQVTLNVPSDVLVHWFSPAP